MEEPKNNCNLHCWEGDKDFLHTCDLCCFCHEPKNSSNRNHTIGTYACSCKKCCQRIVELAEKDMNNQEQQNKEEKCEYSPDCQCEGRVKHPPQNTRGEWEEKLTEIVYRNWKNDDEVGLFSEIKELFSAYKESILAEVGKMKKEIDYDTYCGCDGECFGACKKSYNSAIEDIISKLSSKK